MYKNRCIQRLTKSAVVLFYTDLLRAFKLCICKFRKQKTARGCFSEVIAEDFGPTSESLEVSLFEEEKIPWEELAFPFVPLVIKHYLNDKKSNRFDLRIETIERPAKNSNQ